MSEQQKDQTLEEVISANEGQSELEQLRAQNAQLVAQNQWFQGQFEAFSGEIANAYTHLQDTVLLLNVNLTALIELLIEGRPVKKEAIERRARQVLAQTQNEWKQAQRVEADAKAARQ